MLQPAETRERPGWVFLSNHGYVLLTIAQDPTLRIRDIARAVGITERATMRIVQQLALEGYVRRRRVGRRNVYFLDESVPLRHPTWHDREVRLLLPLARQTAGETVARSASPDGSRSNGGTLAAPNAVGTLGYQLIGDRM